MSGGRKVTVGITRPVEDGRLRVRFLAVVFALAFLSVGIRLIDMVSGASASRVTAARAGSAGTTRSPARAEIRDRNGVLLATNVRILSLVADPSKLPDPDRAAELLAERLSGVEAAELKRRFTVGRRFAWVKRELTPDEQRAVLELGLPGLEFRRSERRVYPQRRLAAHVLGFTGVDNQGLAGIELALDARLRESEEPLITSLDIRVQEVVRETVAAAFRRFRAVGACALVLDRRSGELLALVSLPDFDPNVYEEAGPEQRENRCTGGVYELGSLFKVITAAMALESGKVGLHDRFNASEPIRIGRNRIGDDHAKARWLTVPEIFAFSSNVGTVQMAFAAGGAQAQQAFLERLGMTRPLEIELVQRGRPLVPRRWIDIVSATVSFGHGIAVTPLHFAAAVAGLTGDGLRVRPTLLRRDQPVAQAPLRLVSEQTVRDLRWLMWLVVEKGTGTKARIPGYLVGGKTGTADKPGKGGRGYDGDAVISSFVGVFPIEDPRYVVLVTLDDPKGDKGTFGFRYGGWTAAPAVATIIDRIGPILGVPPSRPSAERRFSQRLKIVPTMNGRTGRMEEGLAALDIGR